MAASTKLLLLLSLLFSHFLHPFVTFEGDVTVNYVLNCSITMLLFIREIETMKSEGASNYSNEALMPVEERKVGKRKAMTKADKSVQQKKQRNAKKDLNKPKRPASAFFVFLEEFRKDFKKEHPDVKAVSAVGKAGGQKWKSMSDAEKAKYEAEAAKRKSEYEKLMKAYNKKQESTKDDGDVEPDWSESDVNDEDEANAEFRNLLLVVLCYLASES